MALLGPTREEIDAAKKAIQRDALIRFARAESPLRMHDAPDWQRAKAELEREDAFVTFDIDGASAARNCELNAAPPPLAQDVLTVAGLVMHALETRSPFPLEDIKRGLNQENEFRPQVIDWAIALLRWRELAAIRDGMLHDLTGDPRPTNRATKAYRTPADPDPSIAAARAERTRREAELKAKAEAERVRREAELKAKASAERRRRVMEGMAKAAAASKAKAEADELDRHVEWLLNVVKDAAPIEMTLDDATKAAAFSSTMDESLVQPAMAALYQARTARVGANGVIHLIEPKPEPKTEPKPVVMVETPPVKTLTEPKAEKPEPKKSVDRAELKLVKDELQQTRRIATDTQTAVYRIGDRIFAREQELTYAEEKLNTAPVEVVKTLRRLLVLLEARGVSVARDLRRGGLSQMQMLNLDTARDLGVLIGAVRVFDKELSLADPYVVFRDRSLFHRLVDAQKERDMERLITPAPQRKHSKRQVGV